MAIDIAERIPRELDERVAEWLRTQGLKVLRYGLALLFIWFGALKPLGLSPASGLIGEVVPFLPQDLAVLLIGLWEILIGLLFLYRPLIRVAVPLMALHILGTFATTMMAPDAVFVTPPFVLTLEGQYVVKNIVLVGAAMVVGGFEGVDESDQE